MPTPRFIPLADLHEDPANVRKHGDRNKASVRASILEFGQVETLVVQRGTGRVLGGNCRLGELRALGREGAWCMEVDVEGIDATRLALALNRTAELAEWDADALGRLLSDLAPQDLGDLWTTEEVGALCATDLVLEPEPAEEDEDAPLSVPAEPVSRLGAVYELGPHRLVCGDCFGDTARGILAGVAAIVTDPPYGIDAQAFGMGAKSASERRAIDSQRGSSAWDAKAPPARWLLDLAPVVCIWGGNYFADLPVTEDWLVWHKKNDGRSFSEAELAWTNLGRKVRVLQHHWSGEKKEHITQKPLPVIRWCLNMLPEGVVVGDPFGGSGTTLIAAAESGRIARLIELDPRYCDVIRRRWTRWARANNRDPGPGYLDDAEPVAPTLLPR